MRKVCQGLNTIGRYGLAFRVQPVEMVPGSRSTGCAPHDAVAAKVAWRRCGFLKHVTGFAVGILGQTLKPKP